MGGWATSCLNEKDFCTHFIPASGLDIGMETALITLSSDLFGEKDRRSVTLLILLDCTTAFDTIEHSILVDYHMILGVRDSTLLWFFFIEVWLQRL